MEYPFVTIKKVSGECWYHGADRDLHTASGTLFYMTKSCCGALEDARIIEIKDQYQLDQLRKTVNNLPDTL
jgi:hypothetical protein